MFPYKTDTFDYFKSLFPDMAKDVVGYDIEGKYSLVIFYENRTVLKAAYTDIETCDVSPQDAFENELAVMQVMARSSPSFYCPQYLDSFVNTDPENGFLGWTLMSKVPGQTIKLDTAYLADETYDNPEIFSQKANAIKSLGQLTARFHGVTPHIESSDPILRIPEHKDLHVDDPSSEEERLFERVQKVINFLKAHSRPVLVHRDLNQGNVLFETSDDNKYGRAISLLDFGQSATAPNPYSDVPYGKAGVQYFIEGYNEESDRPLDIRVLAAEDFLANFRREFELRGRWFSQLRTPTVKVLESNLDHLGFE